MQRRIDGRQADQLRPLTITAGVNPAAEGSCEISMGNTRIWIAASVEDRVPPFLKGSGQGWITAEYGMLPRSGRQRSQREVNRGAPGGRTHEIQRLIGRSLRSVVDLEKLGEKTITLDCDVIMADGGTRTAAITGAFVALTEAFRWMIDQGYLSKFPFQERLAAVSVGVIGGQEYLDLCYEEDSKAGVDMNVVMTDQGRFVEIQSTAEGNPFTLERFNRLLEVAKNGCQKIFEVQSSIIDELMRA
ncbi:MAG: ribonuclease PH [Armatimonadetes bacterium]|nr:ribonuclease PH [Armatimonadota bacterium]